MGKPLYLFPVRSTPAGHASWPDIRAFEVNDAAVCTTPIVAAAAGFIPTTDGLRQIYSSGFANRANASVTEAGGNPLLGGRGALGWIDWYGNPGTYDVRIATGLPDQVGTKSWVAVFDGKRDFVRNLWTGSDLKLWTAGLALANGKNTVIVPDGGIWQISHTGTGAAGTNAPNGAGVLVAGYSGDSHTFTDNAGKVWTRLNYPDGVQLKALYFLQAAHAGRTVVGEVGPTEADPGVDNVPVATWGARSVQLSVSGRYGPQMTFMAATTAWLRGISLQEHAPVLQDIALKDQQGQDVGAAPTLFCHEAVGLEVLEIVRASGDADLQLVGDHADYFEIVTRANGSLWIRAAAPIPDAQAGDLDLGVTQTDLNASGPTAHTTWFTAGDLVSSLGKPLTGKFARMPTLQWRGRKLNVMDHYDARWPGAVGAPTATYTVAGAAALVATYNGLAAGAASMARHRILLQDGVYEGSHALQSKNFGGGWCLIEPAPGHNPQVAMAFAATFRKVMFRGVTFIPDTARRAASGTYQFLLSEPGPAPANGFTVLKFEDCKWGAGFAGVDLVEWAQQQAALPSSSTDKYWQALFAPHAESIEFQNCHFKGTRVSIAVQAARLLVLEDCDTQWSRADFLSMTNAAFASTRGVFPDDHMRVVMRRITLRNEIDFIDYTNAAHTDLAQVNRQVNDNNWLPGITSWANGTLFVDERTYPVRVYKIVAGGGGAFGANPPAGTVPNVNEVNGAVTVAFQYEIPPNNLYLVFEDIAMNADGPLRGLAARQSAIDSNEFRGQKTIIYAFDCVLATSNIIGLFSGSGEVHAAHCAYPSQAHLSLIASPTVSDTPLKNSNGTWNGKIWSFRNVVQQPAYVTWPQFGGSKFESDTDIVQRFEPTSPDPHLVYAGPFVTVASGDNLGWRHAPSLDDSGTNSPAAFRAQLRAIYGPAAGVSAGILSALDAVPDGPTAYTLTKNVGATVAFPTPVILTVALDDAAIADVHVTVACSLAGVFAGGNVVTIPAGQSVGSVTWTPSAPGAAAFSAGDDAGLADPPALNVTVTGASGPTAYALTCSIGPVAQVPAAATLTATLNAAATAPVHVTIASSLAGAFTAGAVITIGIGQTAGSVTWVPAVDGLASFTAADDAGLPDPAPVTVTYLPAAVAPTGYTLVLDDAEVEYPATVTLTATLDAQAVDPVAIAVSASMAGLFPDGAVIAIAAGETQGAIAWIPDGPGDVTFTASDDQDLDPPHSVLLTVLAPPAAPSALEQSLSRTRVGVGGSIQVHYYLDLPALVPIVVTPALEGDMTGVFSHPTVTIPAGATDVTIAFTATSEGHGVLSATSNGVGITDPTPIAVNAFAAFRGQVLRWLR